MTTFAINSSEAGSAPDRCNPASGLHLAEPAIVGRNDDVSRKHHFDADRKDNPRNRGDNGLPTLVRQAECIDIRSARIGRHHQGTMDLRTGASAVERGAGLITLRRRTQGLERM